MPSPIVQAIKQISEEKGISYDSVVKTIEAALAAAFRKDFGEKNQNIRVEFDPETGRSRAFDIKTIVEDMELEELAEAGVEVAPVVEEKPKKEKKTKKSKKTKEDEPSSASVVVEAVADKKAGEDGKDSLNIEATEGEEKKKFNPRTDIMISEAKKIKKDAVIGEEIKTELEIPAAFGRMAAQTAKQVITQKFRESERQAMFDEYKGKEGEVISGVVQRREGRLVLIDLGRMTALLPPEEQIDRERYNPGQRIKVFVLRVEMSVRGPQIVVSRSHSEIVKKLFSMEIPEIANGTIEIKAIAREAGSRSKVAVESKQENIDPIGSCVGQRGTRIQTIISELGGEKVDIIQYDEDASKFIANSLSPAKISGVEVSEQDRIATVTVKEEQLSLAIGKAGQNVRLAAKLTGWKINIVKEKETGEKEVVEVPVDGSTEPVTTVKAEEVKVDGSTELTMTALVEAKPAKKTRKKKVKAEVTEDKE